MTRQETPVSKRKNIKRGFFRPLDECQYRSSTITGSQAYCVFRVRETKVVGLGRGDIFPVLIELTAAMAGPEVEHSLSPGNRPPHSALLQPLLHDVSTSGFDDPGPRGYSLRKASA